MTKGEVPMAKTKVFKTEESRDAIRFRYNQILNTFPFDRRYVETSFGRTFVMEGGKPDDPPLVLLHGSCSNSAFWYGEMSALSQMHHVLAVDIVGEAGNSEENRLDVTSEEYADWLKQVFDACGIKKAVVMGNSLGSWMALRFACKYAECVSKMILMAPSGLSGQNIALLEKAKQSSLQDEALKIDDTIMQGAKLPKEVEDFINLIASGYNPITDELPVISDEQIKSLAMPILFIAGKKDNMVDAVSAAQRLSQLIPDAKIHLEDSGHIILNSLDFAIPFLAAGE